MESFFNTVSNFVNLSEESTKALSGCLKRHVLSKGHILLKPNSICKNIYFIEKGLTRTFYLLNDKDVTDWLSSENTFACSILSFLTQTPDRRTIELLEDSVLWSLSYGDLEDLYSKYHDVEKLGRKLSEFGMIQVQLRFDSLHFATAADRYNNVLENNPDYIKRVPLNILASYLGMSPETLSRTRSRI